jgi:hypothetical protein
MNDVQEEVVKTSILGKTGTLQQGHIVDFRYAQTLSQFNVFLPLWRRLELHNPAFVETERGSTFPFQTQTMLPTTHLSCKQGLSTLSNDV